tara:strand:- start:104 stop:622 length:519 start_codon:yes stop_codon:yes gene_type:complete
MVNDMVTTKKVILFSFLFLVLYSCSSDSGSSTVEASSESFVCSNQLSQENCQALGSDNSGTCKWDQDLSECVLCGSDVVDCDGVCGGNSQLDECGVCNGPGSSGDCGCDVDCTLGCFESVGHYEENCLISDEHKSISFSVCNNNDQGNLAASYTSLADLQGKIILLEMSASW